MALGSFSSGALADLTVDDLNRMLELDETLFVEHKSDVNPTSFYGLASVVAAFANTLGGWLLLGVRDGHPPPEAPGWAVEHGRPLVDVVRDLLRMELDPVPAFEARVLRGNDGPVGVVRVYESSDTPHVSVSTGSVFVREVAGKADAARTKRPGSGRRGDRAYAAAQIRSRAQLLELADRGRRARERVATLTDPQRPLPLVADALGLSFERISEGRVQPRPRDGGAIVVLLLPYTLSARFQGWATTADGSAAVLAAAEQLADRHGLDPSWLTPHPAGASLAFGIEAGSRHCDGAGLPLTGTARVVIDGAGVVGAALDLEAPEERRRAWTPLHDVAEGLVEPVIAAAVGVLRAGEFVGRCWCQVDFVGMHRPLALEGSGNNNPSS